MEISFRAFSPAPPPGGNLFNAHKLEAFVVVVVVARVATA